MKAGYSFKISINDLENNKFHIKYNTVKDVYFYSNRSNQIKELKIWKEGAFSYSNIQYKVENDWKMCYLARTNGSEKAFIEWGFDLDELKSTEKRLERIEIKCEEACFEFVLNHESFQIYNKFYLYLRHVMKTVKLN